MINYSFIIPYYKLPLHYLQRMLNSIPKREDVQIIVVDDASLLPAIEEEKLQDICNMSNAELLSLQKNGGPGVARNEALKIAKGEWIYFADADDYYDTANLTQLMDLAIDAPFDIIYQGFNRIVDGVVEEHLYGFPMDRTQLIEVDKEDSDSYICRFYPVEKIIKRALIQENNLKFDPLYLSEDRVFAVSAFFASTRIARFSCPVYNYDIRSQSLSQIDPPYARLVPAVDVAIRVNRLLKDNDKLGIIRDSTLPKYMHALYNKSRWMYWWQIIKIWSVLGFSEMMFVRGRVCYMRNVRISLFRQWTDPIRVFLGSKIR